MACIVFLLPFPPSLHLPEEPFSAITPSVTLITSSPFPAPSKHSVKRGSGHGCRELVAFWKALLLGSTGVWVSGQRVGSLSFMGLFAYLCSRVTVLAPWVCLWSKWSKPCKAFGTVLANSKHLKIIAIIVILLAPEWAFSRIPGFDFSLFSF